MVAVGVTMLRADDLNRVGDRAHQPVAFRYEVVRCAQATTKTTGAREGTNEESLVQLTLASDSMVYVDLLFLNEGGREGIVRQTPQLQLECQSRFDVPPLRAKRRPAHEVRNTDEESQSLSASARDNGLAFVHER